MNQVFDQISKLKLVPVVKIEAANDALALGEALIAGGLPLVEITFRTDAAAKSIRMLSDALPEMLVGAGTVLTIEQVRQGFIEKAYKVRRDDATPFDLVVDTGNLAPELSINLIVEAARDKSGHTRDDQPKASDLEVDRVLAKVICDVLNCDVKHS